MKKGKKESVKKGVESKKEANPNQELVQAKMQELIELLGKDGDEDKSSMICLIGNQEGVHIAMSGKGEDIAVLVASSMVKNEDVGSVINHGGIMASLKVKADAEGKTYEQVVAESMAAQAEAENREAGIMKEEPKEAKS